MNSRAMRKAKRNEKICHEGCFTVNDLLHMLNQQKGEHNATISVMGAECRYIRVNRRRGEVIVTLDEDAADHD